MKNNKDKFKVYSNDSMPKEESAGRRNVCGTGSAARRSGHRTVCHQPVFYGDDDSPGLLLLSVDVEAEESLMAPMLSPEVLRDFFSNTEMFRKREGVPAALFLHIPVKMRKKSRNWYLFLTASFRQSLRSFSTQW